MPRIPQRVVMVRAALGGAGYRISTDLVLTAAHVVNETGEVNLGDAVGWQPFQRVWYRDDLDVAVIRVQAEGASPLTGPARWGFVGSDAPRVPVEVNGFPNFQAPGEDASRDYEQVDGHVNPLSGARRGQLHISVNSKLWRNGPRPWPGMSGAAVLCHGRVIGVITESVGDSERLAATPTSEFIFDDALQRLLRESTGHDTVVEPADLTEIISVPLHRVTKRSWVSLLRPTADVVPYYPIGDDFIDLYAWAKEPGFGACLLHGDTGVGKTRLAHQLVRAVAKQGGIAAFVNDFDVMSPYGHEALNRLPRLHYPTLLVIDYAETKPDHIRPLVEQLSRAENEQLPVKLLLLARSAGIWWDVVRTRTSDMEDALCGTTVRRLTSPQPSDKQQTDWFVEAAYGFAARLPDFPECAGQDWPAIARHVATATPRADMGAGSPMSCQVAALTALLAAGSLGGVIATQSTRDRLLRHERRYWRGVANQRGLAELTAEQIDDSVALACLYGARSRADGLAVLARYASVKEPEACGAVETYLRQILGETPDGYWQPVQPSSIAEHLVIERVQAHPWVLVGTLPYVRDYQLVHALTVLSRAAPTDQQLWTHVTDVAKKHRQRLTFELLAGAAVAVPDSRGLAMVIDRAHEDLRPDQRAVVSAFTGTTPTEQARRDLWNFYSQAHSNLPEAQLRRAAGRAASILDLLETVRPGLTAGVGAGIDMLAVLSKHIDTLDQVFGETGELAEAVGSGYDYATAATSKARSEIQSASSIFNDLSAHSGSFKEAPGVLDQLGAELTELGSEITEIRNHLDYLAEEFDETE